jgi:hypothetical protein
MRKLLVVLMVLALAAPFAMADDTLDISGTMRARAWSKTNSDYSDADTSDLQYWDQRFRMQGVITPADGVKGVFRIDLAEDTWGSDNWEGSRYGSGSELQVDRAYLDVTKGMVNIKAGQQYMGLGSSYAYDNNQTGLQISLTTPVTVRFGYAKITESGANHDETGFDDTDQYFIDVGYKSKAFSINGFYAMQTDGNDTTQNEPNLIGVLGVFNIGPVNVVSEIDLFGGSYGPDGASTDYTGLQFIANASMKFSDAVTAGAVLIYSDGEDDASEEKITRFPNAFFGSMYFSDLGAFHTDIAPLGDDDVFDPASTNAGAMGGSLYGMFTVMEGLTLSAQYAYLTGSEDGTTEGDKFSSGMVANASVSYALTANTTVAAVYLMADFDTELEAEVESLSVMAARIQVNF